MKSILFVLIINCCLFLSYGQFLSPKFLPSNNVQVVEDGSYINITVSEFFPAGILGKLNTANGYVTCNSWKGYLGSYNNGTMYINHPLDYEKIRDDQIGCTSMDDVVTVHVESTNEDDNPTVVENTESCEIKENDANGNCTFIITDFDGNMNNYQLSFYDPMFSLNWEDYTPPANSTVKHKNVILTVNSPLDYEYRHSYALTLNISDNGRLLTSVMFKVQVIDLP